MDNIVFVISPRISMKPGNIHQFWDREISLTWSSCPSKCYFLYVSHTVSRFTNFYPYVKSQLWLVSYNLRKIVMLYSTQHILFQFNSYNIAESLEICRNHSPEKQCLTFVRNIHRVFLIYSQ